MIFNKLRIFGVIFACVFTLPGFAADRDYYIITLNKNGGTGGNDYLYGFPDSGIYMDTDKTTWASNIEMPKRNGYVFNGYTDELNNDCVELYEGKWRVTQFFNEAYSEKLSIGDKTITAKWIECNSGISYNNICMGLGSYSSSCKTGECRTLEGECVSCPAGRYCDGTKQLWCDKYSESSNLDPDTVAPLCSVNTYSDGGKTGCTSCGIGYTTGNSGPIVTDSEGNISGDGLCLKIDDESGLGYGCTSSRACQMVTPQLCHGNCSCNAMDKLIIAMRSDSTKAAAKTALTNCGVTELVADCLLGNCDDIPTRPFRPIRKTFIGKLANIQGIITNAFLENKKLVRCFCNTSFVLGDNVTTVKTYSDVVDVVYPDDSASD